MVIKNGQVFRPEAILQKSPEEVVQQQLNAYNARDIEAFLATYSRDIQIYNFPDSLRYSGLDQIERVYRRLFERTPALHAQIKNRMVLGNYVIDRERVTGFANNRVINAIAIYEVRENRIRRVWFIRE